MSEQNKELKLISMAEIEEKAVDWLWYPYIPYGKITIVQGDPGEGKTTFILHLAALLSRGESLPLNDDDRAPINIIYQTAEDGLADTIKPRLVEAGADCGRILIIDESQSELSITDERIEQAIIATNARLVVLDPIQAYLGAQVDMHRANEIRPLLKQLAAIADNYGCAIILIGHMNKSNGAKSTYRGLGSIDFQATARSVLIVGRIKDEPTVRVVAHDKSSLAPEGKSIAFELAADEGFMWLGEYDITLDDLLSGGSGESKLKKAEDLLDGMLCSGSILQSEIAAKAQALGISMRVLNQAKKNLGVQSFKKGGKWYWKLE